MNIALNMLLVPVFMLSLLATAEAKDSKLDAAELKKLQGTWVLVSGEKDGKPLPDETVKRSKITFKGGATVVNSPHQSKAPIKGQVTRLDATKTPREMDFGRSKGPGTGKTLLAIYEFDGTDTYKFCFDPSGKTRPTEFATKPGTGYILHVWKRAK